MTNLPPLTSKIDKGAEGGHEFERLLNQLLLCFADRQGFQYEPTGCAGGDRGIDGLARRGGVPGFEGPVAFQFKWLWDGIHKGSKASQITDSLKRAAADHMIRHWILVTPHELTPTEKDWLMAVPVRPRELTVAEEKEYQALLARSRLSSSSPEGDSHGSEEKGRGSKKKRHGSEKKRQQLTPAEDDRLRTLSPRRDLTVHHWGRSRIECLLRDYCPALLARYYPHEAKSLLSGYDGHDFQEFATEYRRKVAIVLGRLRTIGLPPETLRERDAGAEIPLRRVFVPQNLLAEGERQRVATLAQVLGARRSCALLGDPGTGKTTILSFVALLFCGDAELEGFTPAVQVVPLVIPLRDLVKLRKDKTDLEFLEYLASRARSDLNLPHAHQAFFEAKLRMGEAIVLVDGLDEAGGDVSRQRLSTAIQTFQAEFPDCPCWVTSRIYGYTRDVRLPGDVFTHFRVGRLDASQIDDFVARWYAIQYPENAREREQRMRSLQHALHRSMSVQRLAGNPLLLTLMAFIHHGQHSLPQDRGELYEQCIQMLLKTWQEAKREDGLGKLQSSPHPFEKLGLHVATQKDYLAHLAMQAQELNQAAAEDEGRGLVRRADALDCLARRHLERSRRTRPDADLAEAREEMTQFLDYVSDRTGLLIDKGGGQLSFLHLSFQEYLAAWVFTCGGVNESEQRAFFEAHLDQAAWEEVLLLRLYIILRLPGGGGETVFDAVISSLLRKLERQPNMSSWLRLVHAVRDNLEFTARDRMTILQQALVYWLESPWIEGDWFHGLEEVCLFSADGKRELNGLLEAEWNRGERSRAVACLHLLERFGFSCGDSRIDERPDVVEHLFDLLVQHGAKPDWRSTLAFLFGCVIHEFSPDVARQWRDRIASTAAESVRQGRQDNVWKLAVVLGDCLQAPLEPDGTAAGLIAFFRRFVLQAVEQEIEVKERHQLTVALGRLGDPRIEPDLRVEESPGGHRGYVTVPAERYYVRDERKVLDIHEPFWLSRYPVTNLQYALFVEDGGYSRRDFWSEDGWHWVQKESVTSPRYSLDPVFNAPNQPVVGVSWWEAVAFCRWAGGRLPTADESEAASRGPEGMEYPWGDKWEDNICNSDKNWLGYTSAVGLFPRSRSVPLGLEDMAGNVWEWCADEHSVSFRLVRGGGWALDAGGCRSAVRSRHAPATRRQNLGFRVAIVSRGGQSGATRC